MISETTVVTAFYPLKKSKVGIESYRAWIQNFCKIPCAMVIFTTEPYMLEIYEWRREMLDNTKVIVRPFDSFAMTSPEMMSFWEKQVPLDPEKDIHGPELYAIWALKQEFVRIAISHNYYQSKWFAWCDMGIQRYSRFQDYYTNFPREASRLCRDGRMAFLEVGRISDAFVNDWKEGRPLTHPTRDTNLGGGCIIGDSGAWHEFSDAYKSMLQKYGERGWFCGKDQEIFFAVLMEKKTAPFRLFHCRNFGHEPIPPGILWMSFPPMLAGTVEAVVDMRFEES